MFEMTTAWHHALAEGLQVRKTDQTDLGPTTPIELTDYESRTN